MFSLKLWRPMRAHSFPHLHKAFLMQKETPFPSPTSSSSIFNEWLGSILSWQTSSPKAPSSTLLLPYQDRIGEAVVSQTEPSVTRITNWDPPNQRRREREKSGFLSYERYAYSSVPPFAMCWLAWGTHNTADVVFACLKHGPQKTWHDNSLHAKKVGCLPARHTMQRYYSAWAWWIATFANDLR